MRALVLALLALLMGGLVTVLGGCQRHIYSLADGFHTTLPTPQTRIVVWGNHPGAVGTATTWLLKRGLRVVERAKLQQLFNEQDIRLTHTPDDEANILRVGKILGAQTIVFVETKITSQEFSETRVSAYYGRSASYTVYNVGLSLRGVEVETGEISWSGTAHFPEPAANVERGVVVLTCHALATAWGFLPPGEHKEKGVCAMGESEVR